jgi:hypothetical protein
VQGSASNSCTKWCVLDAVMGVAAPTRLVVLLLVLLLLGVAGA